MTIMPALAAWSVVPFWPDIVLANVNAGLLLIMAITSMEVYASSSLVGPLTPSICVLGRDACFRANGFLRNRHGFCLGRGSDGIW